MFWILSVTHLYILKSLRVTEYACWLVSCRVMTRDGFHINNLELKHLMHIKSYNVYHSESISNPLQSIKSSFLLVFKQEKKQKQNKENTRNIHKDTKIISLQQCLILTFHFHCLTWLYPIISWLHQNDLDINKGWPNPLGHKEPSNGRKLVSFHCWQTLKKFFNNNKNNRFVQCQVINVKCMTALKFQEKQSHIHTGDNKNASTIKEKKI